MDDSQIVWLLDRLWFVLKSSIVTKWDLEHMPGDPVVMAGLDVHLWWYMNDCCNLSLGLARHRFEPLLTIPHSVKWPWVIRIDEGINFSPTQPHLVPKTKLYFGPCHYLALQNLEVDTRFEQVPRVKPAQTAQIHEWVENGFDTCLMAAPFHHTASLMNQLLPLLKPSAPFVVSSPFLQALVECRDELVRNRRAALVEIQESFWREYQVWKKERMGRLEMPTGSGHVENTWLVPWQDVTYFLAKVERQPENWH